MPQGDQLLIILPDSNSLSNADYGNPFDGKSPSKIIQPHYGSKLLRLLDEIGAVSLDVNNRLIIPSFYTNGLKGSSPVPRLLGFLAEAIIVDRCKEDQNENRKWANYARRFPSRMENLNDYKSVNLPDNFMAVGTGLVRTCNDASIRRLYNKTDPSRDICWVNKENPDLELLMFNSSSAAGGGLAGIQVKVSTQGRGDYVSTSIINRGYSVPVVYFDLGSDFELTKLKVQQAFEQGKIGAWNHKIFQDSSSRFDFVEQNLIRGKQISAEIHEELEYYLFLLTEVLNGRKQLEALAEQIPAFSTALGLDIVGAELKTDLIRTPLITVPSIV